MKVILIVLVLLLVGAPIALYVSSKPAMVTVDPVKYIGNETPVNVRIDSPHGVRRLTVEIEQDGKQYSATTVETSATRFLTQHNVAPVTVTATVGRKKMPALHDGKARIIVTAVANDMAAASATKVLMST